MNGETIKYFSPVYVVT